MFSLSKTESAREAFTWSRDVAVKPTKSVWARITGKNRNDDDDDMPGPNAGASLWPSPSAA